MGYNISSCSTLSQHVFLQENKTLQNYNYRTLDFLFLLEIQMPSINIPFSIYNYVAEYNKHI
jgi:hypothetical protein